MKRRSFFGTLLAAPLALLCGKAFTKKAPMIIMQWSDDDGITWSKEEITPISKSYLNHVKQISKV